MTGTNGAQQFLTRFHFLKINEGKLIFWDYQNHAQFELTVDHLQRLIDFSAGSAASDSEIDQDILSAGVLGDTDAAHGHPWGWDWLAHIFHYGTCHPSAPVDIGPDGAMEDAKSYLEFCESISDAEPPVEIVKGGGLTELPRPQLDDFESKSLWSVLRDRKTCRDFDGGPVSLVTLSNCLFAGLGEQERPQSELSDVVEQYGYRRTSPSAGGLQSTEAYVWALNVTGLEPAIYHYLPRRHKLELVEPRLPPLSLGAYLCNQLWADDLAFAIILTARFDKMWWKYPHSRAYRPLLMEAGHFSQTLNLALTASGLHPWMTGYFHDKEIAGLLRCDPGVEHPLFVVGGGTGSGNPLDRAKRALLAAAPT
jgi:SagB-type dehydrogenase family enzyme